MNSMERGLGPCSLCHKTAVFTYCGCGLRLCEEHWSECVKRIGGSVAEYLAYCKENGIVIELSQSK